MKKLGIIILISILSFFFLNGCNFHPEKEEASIVKTSEKKEIIIFAAASLNPLLTEMSKEFQEEYPDLILTINAANTQILKTQIEQGAAADLFFAARERDVKSLKEKGLIKKYTKFAGNQLEIVTSEEGSKSIQTVNDLANPGNRIVLADATAPVGEYSVEFLTNLVASKHYNQHLIENIENNIVSYENTEQHVLGKILSGEADAGIVFRSSFKTSINQNKDIKNIPFDEKYNVNSFYYLTELKDTSKDVQLFINWLKGEKAKKVIEQFGLENIK